MTQNNKLREKEQGSCEAATEVRALGQEKPVSKGPSLFWKWLLKCRGAGEVQEALGPAWGRVMAGESRCSPAQGGIGAGPLMSFHPDIQGTLAGEEEEGLG